MQKTPLPALTGARFIAATGVVFYHYGAQSLAAISPQLVPLGGAGPLAVSFFYVLSGTVITWNCEPSRDFWPKRAARILPAYWLALLLSLAPFYLREGAPQTLLHLGACLLLIQSWIPPLAAGLNTPGWSISCEAFFYSVWPFVVGRLARKRAGFPWLPVIALWSIAPLIALTVKSPGENLYRLLIYFPLLRLPEFLIGISLGHALRLTPRAPSMTWPILLLTLAAAWLVGATENRLLIEGALLAPLFALCVWRLARDEGPLVKLLSRPSLLLLGEASYAIYVLQEPVLVWTTASFKRALPALAAHWSAGFWIYFALLVAISLAVHRWVEMPLRKRLTRLWTA